MKTFLYHENGWRMIQAEELPVEPDPEDFPSEESYCYFVDKFNAEIAALKAKSIPVGNPEIFDLMEYGTRKREWIKGYHITGKIYEWPGDVEIKDGVAILTLPKEPQQ